MPDDRPNVLWLVAEDMGPELGCLDTPEVHTRALDRLAAEGQYYERAFTTAPVCSPSRSAMNTGMYQTTIGAHNHRSHRPEDPSEPNPLPEGVRTVSDWLRDAGYTTANVVSFPDGVGFEATGKDDWNFTYRGERWDTDRWADLEAPFYAQVNLHETHRGEFWDTAHERIDDPADPAAVEVPPYYPDHPTVREDWAQYLNAVTAFDRKVDAVVDLLEAEDRLSDTVVVVTADHGRAMLRGKQWCYDSGTHVPLLVRWPENHETPAGYERGTRTDRLVSNIDVAASTLDWAGVPRPDRMQGRVFLGRDPDPPRRAVFSARDRCDEAVDRIRSVRTARYRYVRNFEPGRAYLQRSRYKEANYPTFWVLKDLEGTGELTDVQRRFLADERPPEELYDVRDDPYETENLAADPAHTERLRDFRSLLDRWVRETDDQGRFPEDPAVVSHYDEQMRANFDATIAEHEADWEVHVD